MLKTGSEEDSSYGFICFNSNGTGDWSNHGHLMQTIRCSCRVAMLSGTKTTVHHDRDENNRLCWLFMPSGTRTESFWRVLRPSSNGQSLKVACQQNELYACLQDRHDRWSTSGTRGQPSGAARHDFRPDDSAFIRIQYCFYSNGAAHWSIHGHVIPIIWRSSLEPGPSRARYFPRDLLLLTTTARERAWRLLKISSSLIG